MARILPNLEDDKRSSLHSLDGSVTGRDADPDRVYWRKFAEAATPQAFCQSWLPLQCRMLEGVRCGMILLGKPDQGPFTPVAFWPDAKHNMHHLSEAAERALKERRGLLMSADSKSENSAQDTFHVGYPVEISGKLHGAIVLEVEPRHRNEMQTILRRLHWGAAWIEVIIRRMEAAKDADVNEHLQRVLDLVATVVENDTFSASAISLVTKLAAVFECDRVSLGFVRGKRVRVHVLSHNTDFGAQTNLMRAIGSAMDESLDQQGLVNYPLPADDQPIVTMAHQELALRHGGGSILTIPLQNKGKFIGALTLERSSENPFDRKSVEICESVGALVGPLLVTKKAEERWLIQKIADSFIGQLRRLLGPRYVGRKIGLLMTLVIVALLVCTEIDYRVTAPTAIEGEIQRVVAAPFNSYIKSSTARPGDVVQEGELLCLLDDRDLSLQRLNWLSEREQLIRQHHDAMAKHDRTQIRVLRAKLDQAEAQIALLDEQLSRTKIPAPFRGVIMSGDLSQSLGAPVERGQQLFEVAPLDAYRVIARVDERDIGFISVGQESALMLPSTPGEAFPFTIEKLTPVTTAEEGRNYFRVEGHLTRSSNRLRPGMEGIAKITVGPRNLTWVATHEIVDWLRLQTWQWWP